MMNELTWKLDVKIKDGPQVVLNPTTEVDAYDKIVVEILPNKLLSDPSNKQRVDIQPSEDRLHFLIIKLIEPEDQTNKDAPKLTYKVNGKGKDIPLKDQHVLIGDYAWQLLNEVPKWLTFTSTYDEPVQVKIFIARQATKKNKNNDNEDCISEGE